MPGVINLGDIVWGLGPDTSKLRSAVRDILDFGDAVEQAAQSAADGAAKTEAAFRRQEAAIVSSMQKMQLFNQQMRQAGAPPELIKQSQNAFKELTSQMTAGELSLLQYQRATERFRTEMTRVQLGFRDWKKAQDDANPQGFAAMLNQLARAASLTTGPLSGVASRLNILSSLVDDNTLRLALWVGGVAAASYAMVKLSESTVGVEEKLLRTRMELVAMSGSTVQMQADMKYTLDIANQFGESFLNIADHFAKFELAAQGTSIEGSKVRDLFRDIISYSANMAQSQEQLAAQLNRMTEMITRGRMQWQDFRGFLSREYPEALKVAADATGMTIAQFERALRRGDVIAAQFLPKFFSQLNVARGFDPSQPVDNLIASQKKLSNEILVFNNALNQTLGLSDSYKRTLDSITGALDFLSGHMDTAVKVTLTLAAALAGAFIAPRILAGITAVIGGLVSLVSALISATTWAAVFTAFLSPVGWLALAGGIAAAGAAWYALDGVIKTNRDRLVDVLPDIKAFNDAYDAQGRSALQTAQAIMAKSKADLVAAQAAAINAEAQASVTSASADAGKAGGDAAGQAWWEFFKTYFTVGATTGATETGQAMTETLKQLSSDAVANAAKKVADAQSRVKDLTEQIARLQANISKMQAQDASHRDPNFGETDRQRRMRLAQKEMDEFISQSNREFTAMQQGPRALADAMEQIQLEKTIEGWRDKLERAGFTASEVKDKMVVLATAITKVRDAQLFDKQFMSLGQFAQFSLGQLGTNAVDTFVKALNEGTLRSMKFKDFVLNALEAVEKKALELAVVAPLLNALFGANEKTLSLSSGGTGTGGLLGGLFKGIGSLFGGGAGGGVPNPGPEFNTAFHGGSAAPSFRLTSPFAFVGAPRLHSGLSSDEFPAILQRGETVLPKGYGGRGGDNNVVVNVHTPPGSSTSQSRSSVGGTDIFDIVVQAANQAIGTGKVDKTMANRYGVQPRTTLR